MKKKKKNQERDFRKKKKLWPKNIENLKNSKNPKKSIFSKKTYLDSDVARFWAILTPGVPLRWTSYIYNKKTWGAHCKKTISQNFNCVYEARVGSFDVSSRVR